MFTKAPVLQWLSLIRAKKIRQCQYSHSVQYILPKMPTTMPPPGCQPSDRITVDDSTPTVSKVTANLRSLRPASLLTLSSLDPSTSIHALKTQFANKSGTGATVDKIKILFNKKPVADSKTLAECAEGSVDVDFNVMVVGGTPGGTAATSEDKNPMESATSKISRVDLLASEEFWTDLKGWLGMKLKDDGEGERVLGIFRNAVSGR